MGTDIHHIFQKKTGDTWTDIKSEYEENRHYTLFAWLGNVRNGRGFAGVPTHTPLVPLSDGRGYPDGFDVSDDRHPITDNAFRGRMAKYYADEDQDPDNESYLKLWMGDHSHSWLSGGEILSAAPPHITTTGIVEIAQFRQWDGVTAPTSWCGGISGNGIVVAEDPSKITAETTHVRINWPESCAQSFGYFIDEVKRLTAMHDEIRMVFGFDS